VEISLLLPTPAPPPTNSFKLAFLSCVKKVFCLKLRDLTKIAKFSGEIIGGNFIIRILLSGSIS